MGVRVRPDSYRDELLDTLKASVAPKLFRYMASVYILFSKKLNRFYTGSCLDLSQRLDEHLQGVYTDSFTSKATDWELFLHIKDLAYQQARLIELHIKKMKSRTYIKNLKKYEDIQTRLIMLYR